MSNIDKLLLKLIEFQNRNARLVGAAVCPQNALTLFHSRNWSQNGGALLLFAKGFAQVDNYRQLIAKPASAHAVFPRFLWCLGSSLPATIPQAFASA